MWRDRTPRYQNHFMQTGRSHFFPRCLFHTQFHKSASLKYIVYCAMYKVRGQEDCKMTCRGRQAARPSRGAASPGDPYNLSPLSPVPSLARRSAANILWGIATRGEQVRDTQYVRVAAPGRAMSPFFLRNADERQISAVRHSDAEAHQDLRWQDARGLSDERAGTERERLRPFPIGPAVI